jgi:hypothetical protein
MLAAFAAALFLAPALAQDVPPYTPEARFLNYESGVGAASAIVAGREWEYVWRGSGSQTGQSLPATAQAFVSQRLNTSAQLPNVTYRDYVGQRAAITVMFSGGSLTLGSREGRNSLFKNESGTPVPVTASDLQDLYALVDGRRTVPMMEMIAGEQRPYWFHVQDLELGWHNVTVRIPNTWSANMEFFQVGTLLMRHNL